MSDNTQSPRVVCFGEVLWDIFPTYKKIGGAPLNVAYHLHKMGIASHIITKVGTDDAGQKIVSRLKEVGACTSYIQTDSTKKTGTVFATFDDHNEASYEFLKNSAWDFIDFKQEDFDLVAKSDAFVFGTLASRTPHTRETLHKLLDAAKYKVYDVNLRPPHYELEFVVELMHKADLLKMNKFELKEILEYLEEPYTSEENAIKFVQKHFDCDEIIISKGDKGGLYLNKEMLYSYPAVDIVIRDTVGSGDSYLSGFLSAKLNGYDPIQIIKTAASLGAFVTSHTGANPEYEREDFDIFYYETIFKDELITSKNILEEPKTPEK
ncbi:carbohydrate kinase [Myroides odoratimimus]|uniref:carbohydrate kinase family protein n=1 Tax=Myroides odoratimimus TaxID=76832 RepID=UPI003100D46D